ncbi:MAG: pyruvate carboxylase subunit B [Chloroflexi bacterium]|nr:pyruvate carboxylase subunit B [Chloroflexota bacterium]
MEAQMKARKSLKDKPLKITDTTFRDGHQSILATRMRTPDMEPIASEMDKAGFYSMEVWGGATFDVCTRFLNEDPWERVRTLKRLMPNTPLQMLLRGQNLTGYRNYADDVVRAFVHYAAEVGIDIFRVFDCLNDERNMEVAFKAIKECGKHVQGTICYSLTESKLGGPVYNLDYFVKKALTLQDMGADSICVKDMAGLIAPYDAYELIGTLKEKLKLPVQLHTHYTSGMGSMSALMAAEAGVDIIDTSLTPLALRTSQPAVEPIVVALQRTPRDTGLNLEHLLKLSQYIESIWPKYRDLLDTTRISVIDTMVLSHQIPGGMASNFVAQLAEAGALDKLQEVYRELPQTRRDLGYPPLVTPSSQIVGIQAVSNVLFGRYKNISAQVKDYVYGLYGHPPAPIDPEVIKVALKDYQRGHEPITCRPADILEPEMEKAKEATKGIAKNMGDILIYALYPVTGMRFLKWKYGLEKPPDDVKPKTMEDVKRENELITKAKKGLLVEKEGKEVKEIRVPGTRARSFNVYVGDEYFRVDVEPIQPSGASGTPATAPASVQTVLPRPSLVDGKIVSSSEVPPQDKGTPVIAPMPGIVLRYEAQVGQKVKAGDKFVIFEAMKMETVISAPIDGIVKSINFAPGTKVNKNEVLAVIVS